MPFTNAPWDGGAVESGQEAEEYCRCCLIDTNEGDKKVKAACKLPVRATPGGPYNLNAMAAAAGALAGARTPMDVAPDVKRRAARRLVALYREAEKMPPPALLRIAGMKVE